MSKIILQIKIFPGLDIKEIYYEAKTLIYNLDIGGVEFNFNGVNISIMRDTSIDEI